MASTRDISKKLGGCGTAYIDRRNDYISNLRDTFKSNIAYEQVTVNDETELLDVWISKGDLSDKSVGYKKIFSYPYDTIKFKDGDYVHWDNSIYLIDSLDDTRNYEVYGRMYRCNDNLRWFDENGVYYEYPCVVFNGISKQGFTEESSEIPRLQNLINLIVQQDINTYNIPYNWRFIFGKQVFRLTKSEEYVNNSYGALALIMEKDEENSKDDFVNKIADNGIMTVEIVGGDITNNVGYTQQLSAIVKRDGEVVSGSVTWESSDADFVTVDDTGLVTFVATGSATITAKLNDFVSDSINCTVQAVPANNYEIIVSPDDKSIGVTETVTYNVKLLNNDVDTGQTFVFTDLTSGANYEFVAIDGNNFSVKNENAFSGSVSIQMANINKTETYIIRFSPW